MAERTTGRQGSDRLIRFLNDEGLISIWPKRQADKALVLSYLASFFERGIDYKEKEVNAIIDSRHTFGDFFLLRREMIDRGMMRRTPNGSRYWKP